MELLVPRPAALLAAHTGHDTPGLDVDETAKGARPHRHFVVHRRIPPGMHARVVHHVHVPQRRGVGAVDPARGKGGARLGAAAEGHRHLSASHVGREGAEHALVPHALGPQAPAEIVRIHERNLHRWSNRLGREHVVL